MYKVSKLSLLVAVSLISSVGYAQVPAVYNTDTTVSGSAESYEGTGYGISINNGATITMTGDETVSVTSTGGETVAFDVTGGNLNADSVKIKVTPKTGIAQTNPKGMIVRGNSNVKIDTFGADITLASADANANGSPDSNAAYGLAIGYNHNGGAQSDTVTTTIGNADIKVTNTADTTVGVMKKVINFFTSIPVFMESGHQLSGIRIYRTNGAKPVFISNGQLNIEVTDSSTAKSGDYLAGVYISGNDASATFDGETNIKIVANGVNSAGIKIGKPLEDSNAGASVTANGKLTVDTTGTNGTATFAEEEQRGSGAIRLFGDHSKFIITGTNTTEASVIKASTNAIVFDTKDYATVGGVWDSKEDFSRNANNENNIVSLHNTELSTTSETDALIKANSNYAMAGMMMTFGSSYVAGKLNTGLFEVKNATFNLSGALSKATAAKNGWLMYSNSAYETNSSSVPKRVYSELTANISDQALVIGQIHKEESARLNVTIEDGAIWRLAKKGDVPEQCSTASAVTLANEGTLDAGTNVTDGNKSIYNIKLTSDGTTFDGLFKNGGIITMVNNSYEDIVTIDGNYTGNSGKVKMNTEWNSPGNKEGGNSKSDLLVINGTADGSTTVIPVGKDGKEAIVDGSIGTIADLHAITVPVVRIKEGEASASDSFVGVAKTTGAGELQLRTRVNDEGMREYFWEVMTAGTPIYNKGVSGYSQMPQVDMDLGYASMRTLHERRGENNKAILVKETSGDEYDQTWARIIKDYIKMDGKDRLSYKNHIDGIQIGYDFDIKESDHTTVLSGIYFSYLQGQADFFDHYKVTNGLVNGDTFTGMGKGKSYSLGVTRTSYKENGTYLDIVAQLSLLRNTYHIIDSQKLEQNGWGFGASVESGRPYVLKENGNQRLVLEPQGQLVFQYVKLNDMNHDNKSISQPGQYGLKGRIGARLSYNTYTADGKVEDTIYGVVNIWQHLTGARATTVGQDRITEHYARTVGEIGIGAQVNLSESTYLYGDFRYQHSLGGLSTTGYRGQIGIKYTF